MIKPENFEISLPHFEGPFDLLLFFIERDELNIHDVPIAKITHDFLNYLHQMSTLNMEIASEFIFVAATLMRIKARTLLPSLVGEEETDEPDLKEDLIQRLIAYKQFKEACEGLRILEERRLQMSARMSLPIDLERAAQRNEKSEELESFDLYKLMHVYERVMRRHLDRHTEVAHHVQQYPYTIEAQKERIARLLELDQQLNFQDLLRESSNRIHFVYNFLAILEMLQQQLLEIQVETGYNNFILKKL